MSAFDWPAWFKRVELQVNGLRRNEIGELYMKAEELTAAVKELTDAVNNAVTVCKNSHTPDEVVVPLIQQISLLSATLKSAFPTQVQP